MFAVDVYRVNIRWYSNKNKYTNIQYSNWFVDHPKTEIAK